MLKVLAEKSSYTISDAPYPVVSGISLYHANKPEPRYMMNIVHDLGTDLYRFDYSMFCAGISKKTIKNLLPDNFSELVKKHHMNKSMAQQANSHYRNMLQALFPVYEPMGFIKNEPARAITISYYFDPLNENKITGSNINVTQAYLKGTIAESDAGKLYFESKEANVLHIWQQFLNANYEHPTLAEADGGFVSFQSIKHKTSHLVERDIGLFAEERNIEVLWRTGNKQKSNKSDRVPVNFHATSELTMAHTPLLQLTKPDREAAAINLKLLAHYLEGKGQLLSREKAAAVAAMCQDQKLEHCTLG